MSLRLAVPPQYNGTLVALSTADKGQGDLQSPKALRVCVFAQRSLTRQPFQPVTATQGHITTWRKGSWDIFLTSEGDFSTLFMSQSPSYKDLFRPV